MLCHHQQKVICYISETLLTPAWLGIMHGGGGNISVKLNDSNFGGKRMTLITFFSRRKFIGILTSNSDLQAISAQLHNWSQTLAVSRAQHNCLRLNMSEHKKTTSSLENRMTNF